jgi:Type IV leader peptidase family.
MAGLSLILGIMMGCVVNKSLHYLGENICDMKAGRLFCGFIMGMVSLFFYVRESLLQEWFFGVLYSAFLLGIALFDYYQGLILNKVLFFMAAAGLFANYFCLHLSWIDAFGGTFLGVSVLVGLCFLSHGGIGGGDIKFVGVLGIWLGWQAALLSLFLAFTSGAFVGILLVCLRRKERQDHIAFGPFLAGAAFISYVYGSDILAFYEVFFL